MTFSTNNIAQILGDDTGEKWIQINGNLKKKQKKNRKKTQLITCMNYNLNNKNKTKQKHTSINTK